MRPRREFFATDVLLDARLASRHRARRVAISVGAHVAVVVVLLLLPKSSPVRVAMDDAVRVVFYAPEPPAPMPAPAIPLPPAPKPKNVPKPEPAPRPTVPPPPRVPEPAPAPAPAEVARVEPAPPPAPPARKPVTGLFADAPASPPPVLARKGTVAAAGFEVQPAVAAPSRATRAVAPTGFESDAAPASRPAATRPSVQAASFDAKAEAPAPRPRARRSEAADTPVEIVSKPRPAYTEQARRLRVEGEVVLEVVFFADGRIAVVRVLEGLGHGLDESAIEAAKKIEFQPARREGRPVDHEATLRIVFKLA